MEDGLSPDDEGKLDVNALVEMFENAEEATVDARKNSERDRDYVDNIQLTSTEIAALNKRGQPPTIINRIKRKVDYLVGLEKQQRVDPKAMPRTPVHEQDADGATQGLRYVAESEDYDHKRSSIWRNMLVEGAGGMSVAVEPQRYNQRALMSTSAMTPPEPEYCVVLRRTAWDRMFWDPHSSETDFSDAAYLGIVIWMDHSEAVKKYGQEEGAKDVLDSTLEGGGNLSDTYDDKPKWRLWADKKRKRIRICQIWIRSGDEWHFAEFTKGGILKAGPSPYKTDKGESDCELIFQSAYVNRENERYGVVREMISPQDEINKRRSKALHLINTSQIVAEEGVLKDPEATRREAARPDGMVIVRPGAMAAGAFKFETRTDLATAQFQLLQEAKSEIDMMGPNAAMQGDAVGGSSSASGKAVIASQQGGMIEMGDLLDNLRHFDVRVYRAIWARIRQYWTAEKWIRVTDDERNVKWLGMNVDPAQAQMLMQQNPEMGKKIAGMVQNVAELDCDIIIEEAPDSVTPALEQFHELVELKKADVKGEIPFRLLVEAAPNLKNKDKILEMMDKGQEVSPQAAQAQQLQMAGAAAEVRDTEAAASLKEIQAVETAVNIQLAPQQAAAKQEADKLKAMRPPASAAPRPYQAA